MKKLFLGLIAFTIIFNSISCSNNDEMKDTSYSELKSFNNSFQYEGINTLSKNANASRKRSCGMIHMAKLLQLHLLMQVEQEQALQVLHG
jgi:hypothetical protein